MIFFDTCTGRFMEADVESVDVLRQRVEEVNHLYTQEGSISVKDYYDRINVNDQWLSTWLPTYKYGGFNHSIIPGNFSVETAEIFGKEGKEVAIVLTPGCFEPE